MSVHPQWALRNTPHMAGHRFCFDTFVLEVEMYQRPPRGLVFFVITWRPRFHNLDELYLPLSEEEATDILRRDPGDLFNRFPELISSLRCD